MHRLRRRGPRRVVAGGDVTGLVRTGLGDGAWIALSDGFLAEAEADGLLAALRLEVAWEQRFNQVDGEARPQARLVGWAGALPYRYSGQTLPPAPVPPSLARVWARIEAACDARFNHAVFNRYRDGRDHIARHTDNEPELGPNPTIAGISLGAPRRFVLEARFRRGRVRTVTLRHGQLFVMGGSCQRTWRHGLPPAGDGVGERVNVTFRWLHGPPGSFAPGDPRGQG